MKSLIIFLMLAIMSSLLAGEKSSVFLQKLSQRMNQAENWSNNSSGKMSHKFDKASASIRFDVTFTKGQDYWIYPEFHLKPGESLEGAEKLTFEIKPESSDFRYACVMLSPGGTIAYSYKGDGWQSVSIKLNVGKIELEKVKIIRIGMNPKTEHFSFQLRNIAIVPQKNN